MNNRKKCLLAIVSGIAIMASLSACSMMNSNKEFDPAKNSIFVKHDKTVQSAVVESAQGDQYNAADLQAYAQAEADTFNSENGGPTPAVSIASCEKNGDVLSIIFSYSSPADMIAWAQYSQDDSIEVTDMSVMTVGEADTGLLDTSLVDAKGNVANIDSVKKATDDIVILVSGTADIVCEGDIEYMSSDVTKTDSNCVSVQNTEGNSVIIFK